MGTVHIKNLSSLQDSRAVAVVADFWKGNTAEATLKELGIEIKKKGHTFTVLDRQEQ